HDGDAVLTAANFEIGSITAPGSVALTANSGGIVGVNGATHLSTGELVLVSAGGVVLTTNVNFLSAMIFQQGDLHITDTGQLQVDQVTVSHGYINIEAPQELVITGGVVAEQGQISLT